MGKNFFRIHLKQIKRFNDIKLLSLSATSTDQNHPFDWLRFENRFLKLFNNDDKKGKKNYR